MISFQSGLKRNAQSNVTLSDPVETDFAAGFCDCSWLTSTGARQRGTVTVHWLADGWHRRRSWLIQMRVVMALTESPGSQSPKKTQVSLWLQFERLQSQAVNIFIIAFFITLPAQASRSSTDTCLSSAITSWPCNGETFIHWMNARLEVKSATKSTSTRRLAVYFRNNFFTCPLKTFAKTSHIQNSAE